MIDRRSLLGAAAALSALDLDSASATVAAVPPPPSRAAWRDPARDGLIPVLIRCPAAPASDAGPAPLVVLSHGLGGTRDGLAYLGEALAGAGYVAVHLQHPGSDAAIWQGAPDMRSAAGSTAMNPGAALTRLGDIVFALDHLLAGGKPSLRGLVDPGRIAAAG